MIGIFGGSFDPVHFGHIKSALSLLKHFEFQQIRFVPCQLSPHKNSMHASVKHRVNMLNLICQNQPRLVVDDRELKRPPPSYTIDTLIELRQELGASEKLVLIMGMDAYQHFCQWWQHNKILLYCHLMLMQRPGYSMPKSDCEKEYLDAYFTENIKTLENSPNGHIYISDLEKINVSSTAIRKSLTKGEQPKYAIPGNIWNYIKRNKLYE